MNLLIDGHNLIGAGVFDDIHLSDEDDEAKLVARLRVWKSRLKGKMTVIFDRGIPGGRDRMLGGAGVDVVFASDPAQADDLIRRRLRRGGKGMVLVTQDAALRREARAYGVPTWSGAELIRQLAPPALPVPESGAGVDGTEADVQLSSEEVAEWLRLFGTAKRKAKRRTSTGRASTGRASGGRASSGRTKKKDGGSKKAK